jgi:hypothetical protein
MKKKSYKEDIVDKILRNEISEEELSEFRSDLKSNPEQLVEFKKDLALRIAVKQLDELDMEVKMERIFANLPDDIQLSPANLFRSLSRRIQLVKKLGNLVGQEIKEEVLRILNEFTSWPDLEKLLIPLRVDTVSLLGAEDSEKIKDQEQKYLTESIKLSFIPFESYKMEDFEFQYTGKFIYIVYAKEDFRLLKDRKVNLMTNIGSPFIFTAIFKETHNTVTARIKIEFDEEPDDLEVSGFKSGDLEFLLSID